MNIQPKLDFHFVKSTFSEMPCINRTTEVYLSFSRSELFIIFAENLPVRIDLWCFRNIL